ncbi:MAG: RNA-binding S4 domain-containing protein [Bombilactobacillus mellifer]|nr:RNA-binding S4 domain-containing protein [Bombilactobacillus mellifer]
MRLDKFLKVSRLIKRRTIAKELADAGRIEINGRIAKSASFVKVNDKLKIHYGSRILNIVILNLNDNAKKEQSKEMYEILSEN